MSPGFTIYVMGSIIRLAQDEYFQMYGFISQCNHILIVSTCTVKMMKSKTPAVCGHFCTSALSTNIFLRLVPNLCFTSDLTFLMLLKVVIFEMKMFREKAVRLENQRRTSGLKKLGLGLYLLANLPAVTSDTAFISSATFGERNRQTLAYADDNTGAPNGVKSAIHLSERSNVSSKNLPPACAPSGGRITMVGSGPGDPDLLTMAAHKILADPTALVVSDRLVSQEILNLIQGEVKVARKLPGCAEQAQEEVGIMSTLFKNIRIYISQVAARCNAIKDLQVVQRRLRFWIARCAIEGKNWCLKCHT